MLYKVISIGFGHTKRSHHIPFNITERKIIIIVSQMEQAC